MWWKLLQAAIIIGVGGTLMPLQINPILVGLISFGSAFLVTEFVTNGFRFRPKPAPLTGIVTVAPQGRSEIPAAPLQQPEPIVRLQTGARLQQWPSDPRRFRS